MYDERQAMWQAMTLASCLLAAQPAETSADLGTRVVAYCRSHLGERIGRGECTDLVDAALRSAGARGIRPGDPNPDDYNWGTLVWQAVWKDRKLETTGQRADIRPGDVIQFENVKVEGREGRGTYWMMFPHHSAVVASVADGGKTLQILQQNDGRGGGVAESRLRLDDQRTGSIKIYRPVPARRGK